MSNDNPYEAPDAESGFIPPKGQAAELENVRSGQRFIIIGILLYFAAIFLQFKIGPIAALLALGTMVLGIIGIVRMSRGLGYSVIAVFLLLIAMLLPLIGLIVLLWINGKATTLLKENGYSVGLLGANKPVT